jgi:GNAT superfamily N-acetyltransferase
MEKQKKQIETLELNSKHWEKIRQILKTGEEYQCVEIGEDLEFRFFPLPHAGYSALLSYKHKDVFHLMWEEVSGLINVSHRIVNPAFRGQGIGTEMLYALEQRVQELSNKDKVRYSLMIETTQLSVVKLGVKRGMLVTMGKHSFKELEAGKGGYQVDEKTHVSRKNGKLVPFRVSKAFTPLQKPIIRFTDATRTNVLQILKLKAA